MTQSEQTIAGNLPSGTPVGRSADAALVNVPTLPDDVVDRPRLFIWLAQAVSSPVTTITAPPGWGKTQLLASWVRSKHCTIDVGWLTVDRRDVDPARFWPAVRAAVAHLLPRVTDHSSSGDAVAPLFEELAALREPLLLILDDVHWLDGSPAESELSWLLARLPPLVRVVLCGVYLPRIPASRFRIEGKLRALTAKDLSFNSVEAAEMLMASGLDVSADTAARLQTRTEGWSAGLRLAALALHDAENPEQFLDEFTGDDADVADYLATEVLSRLPDDLVDFLLRTSVCETVTADLAFALTGRPDSEQQLRWLAQHNMFVIADTPNRGWFRYHGMFAEQLRSRLVGCGEPSAASLHRIACTWFGENDMPVMAYRHACLAESWEDAERIILDNWLALYLDGRLETVQRLVDQLPEHVHDANPEIELIGIAAALALGGGGVLDTSDAALAGASLDETIAARRTPTQPESASEDSAERHPLADPPPPNPHATTARLVVDLERGRLSGDLRAVAVAAHGTTAMLSERSTVGSATANDLKALALQQLGITEYWVGRRADAEAHLRESLSVAHTSGRAYVELGCLSQLVGVLTAQNRLTEALEVAEEASQLARDRGWELTGAVAELWHARGWAAYMRGDLDAAEQHLAAASAAVRRQDSAVRATVLLVRGLVTSLRGRKRDALADLDATARIVDRMPARYVFDDYLMAERARMRLAVGDTVKARSILRACPEDPAGPIILTVARAEFLVADGNTEQAITLLGGAVEHGLGLHDEVLQAMVLLALLRDQRNPGDEDALAILDAAVDLAAPERFVQPFLQFGSPVERLLGKLKTSRARHPDFVEQVRSTLVALTPDVSDLALGVAQSSLVEPLTKRELQVLRAIAEPGAFPELADRLYVSRNTLKFHLRSVYRKLDVKGRHEAVIKARALGLV